MKSNSAKMLAGLALCLCLQCISAKSLSGLKDQAFMIFGSQKTSNILRRHARSAASSITSMRVTSVVRSRFAKVTTVSEMENTHDEAKELTFTIRLPDAAFITGFDMLVDGVTFVGKVKEKALAEEEYKKAAESGHSAGLITAKVRETHTFSVAANVPARSSVTFTLVYQELLKRKFSKYNHEIFVHPGQIVDDFVIDVYITERSGFTLLDSKSPHKVGEIGDVDPLSGYDEEGNVPIDIDVRRSKYQAKLTFKPSQTQQRRLLMIPENDRKMTVIYDVTREELGGDIQIRNGYFVHYFAPENLPVLPKKIVFVIDRSGSMSGTKMTQTKTAFETVLKEMSELDEFNIVTFANDVTLWRKKLVSVTEQNVNDAIIYVRNIRAGGGTNLNDGLLRGAKQLKHVKPGDRVSSAIITLSDGDPTSGVTDETKIRLNVKKAVKGKFSVFCLGFGKYLNHDFLKRMANENDGISRQIYEESDASLQLEGFFKEVAAPLLLRVQMTYSGSAVSDVSKTNYEKYFRGSEVMVVGAKLDHDKPLKSTIVGTSVDGDVEYSVVSNEFDEDYQHWYEDTGDFDDFIERIWAYYTIKEKLKQKLFEKSDAEVKKLVDEAMTLALKYHFVTPLTSLVVVLPEDEITTTPPTSTEFPPLPPCWDRGQPIPDYIIEPPILCPYVIDEEAEASIPSHQSSPGISPSLFSGRYMAAPGPAGIQPMPASLGRIFHASAQMMHYSPQQAGIMEYDSMYGYNDYYSAPTIERASNCSGTLNSNSGIVSMPGLNHSLSTVYCEWDIQLPEGSWIDLKVEKLDMSSNDVVIKSNQQELVNYQHGVNTAKYFYISHNEISVVMTVYPEETKQQGIVLSYQIFSPNDSLPQSPGIVPPSNTNERANCGHTITPLDGESGFFMSPNYPSAYPSNSHCSWRFENFDSTKELQITFVDMDIETNGDGQCTHDRVLIAATIHGVSEYCGAQPAHIFSSIEEVVYVKFFSDENLETSGFKAYYEFVHRGH
ncbi:inter-alpha-trypsin inhibitor heavy chain H3-like [Styela clava]